MPSSTMNASDRRLAINMPLTRLAQGYKNLEYVLKVLFPFAPTNKLGGQLVNFGGSSAFDDVDDNRADDGFYKSVQVAPHRGAPFQIKVKGLSFRIGDLEWDDYMELGIDPDMLARDTLMNKFGLRHEIEAALKATNPANYHVDNRVTLTSAQGFQNQDVDPGPTIRKGISAINAKIGADPNVIVMGRNVFDAIAENKNVVGSGDFRAKDFLTLDAIASRYGFAKALVCNALYNFGGQTRRVFGNDIVIARVNPAALTADQTVYAVDPNKINILTPSYGYTYVYKNNPVIYTPYYDNDRSATVYKGDFNRTIELTGADENNLVTAGYLISNAVTVS